MRRKIEILLLMAVAMLATGCNKAPVDAGKMEDILFDIYRTDACLSVVSRNLTPEEKVKYYDSIFEKHGVTKEEFDEALDWYAHHTKEWQMIHENLEKRSDEFMTKVGEYEFCPSAKPVVQDSIDTLDLWVPKSHWEWSESDGEIDRRQTDYTWDDRKFFIGARNLRFEMKMRCWKGTASDTATKDSVTTMMVLKYSKGANDTLKYVAAVDSVERVYKFNKMTRGKSVSLVRVVLMDTIEGLKGVNVKGASLKYAYNNKEELRIEDIRNDLMLLRRDVRTKDNVLQEEVRFEMPKGGLKRPRKR